MLTGTNVLQVERGRLPPDVHLHFCSPFRLRQKTMVFSSLVAAYPYLGPRSNYAQSQGLNRKQPWLVCASAVIKRGAKKGINDLIEEERKGGNHTDSGSGGESMNGAPGTLLERGIVGLLKCVKILVVLQSRWRLGRSHTIHSPLCRAGPASFVSPRCFAAKVHGWREEEEEEEEETTTTQKTN